MTYDEFTENQSIEGVVRCTFTEIYYPDASGKLKRFFSFQREDLKGEVAFTGTRVALPSGVDMVNLLVPVKLTESARNLLSNCLKNKETVLMNNGFADTEFYVIPTAVDWSNGSEIKSIVDNNMLQYAALAAAAFLILDD